ncbi:MAG: phosphomannomutase/phosphoglucomutase [Pseudomonadota bacterium]
MVKKTATEAAEKPAKKEKAAKTAGNGDRQVGGLFHYTLITAIACIVVIALGAMTVKTYILDSSAAIYGERLANAYARQYTGFFNQFFSQSSRQLGSIAASTQVVGAISGGDTAALQQLGETLSASMVGKSRVFLMTNSMPLADIPLGFTAQNMVERLRRGEAIEAEIIPLKEQPLLLLAAPIRNAGGQTIGVLLAGFDLAEVSANLKAFDGAAGYMSMLQRIEETGEEKSVLSHGDRGHEGSPYHAETTTIHPNIRVVFHLNPMTVKTGTRDLFLLAMAVIAALVAAAVFVSHLLLRHALVRNAAMLQQYAESLLRRAARPAGISFNIDIFDDVAKTLGRSVGNNAVAAPAPAATPAMAPAPARKSRTDTIDVEMSDEDAAILDGGQESSTASLSPEIFRAYDIRGVVGKTLTEETVRLIGRALGSESIDQGQKTVYVGRDGRLSGPQLMAALTDGLVSTGCRVIDLGMVPTPLVYFACANTAVKSGIVLTGSHNPADHNGLKMVINGETLADARIQALKERIVKNQFREGKGSKETLDIAPKYVARIKEDVVLARQMKIVVDCGNGVAGAIAPGLLAGIGCEVIPLYCEVDGNFPNHHPDPSKPDNLKDLIAKVAETKADFGVAFDGDGDRIGVVTPQGKMIYPDRLMMLFSRDLLMRSPGADIIFDVKCTRDLATVISENGGRPLMWRTGHSLIKAKLKETGAALAGEMSGHIFFNDRWFGFDDALYSAARLLEILSLEVASIDEVFAEFPSNVSTPELQIPVPEANKFRIIEQLQKQGNFGDGNITTIDGVRVDYADSWGLVRASNTTATLVCRFEGRTQKDLDNVSGTFREQLLKIDSSLSIPF